jgi:hypothetical protein
MSDVGESRWFKVSLFIFSAVATVVVSFNLWGIIKLRNAAKNNTNLGVTNGETTFLLVANIVLLVIAVALLIYSIYKLSVSKKSRQQISKNVVGAFTTTEGGYEIVEVPAEAVKVEKTSPAVPARRVLLKSPPAARPSRGYLLEEEEPSPVLTRRVAATGARSRVPLTAGRRVVLEEEEE